jgi:hypothetical protein
MTRIFTSVPSDVVTFDSAPFVRKSTFGIVTKWTLDVDVSNAATVTKSIDGVEIAVAVAGPEEVIVIEGLDALGAVGLEPAEGEPPGVVIAPGVVVAPGEVNAPGLPEAVGFDAVEAGGAIEIIDVGTGRDFSNRSASAIRARILSTLNDRAVV